MWWLTMGLVALLQATAYPPPFPRPGVVKLIENERVLVWDVIWPKGEASPVHRHPYDMTGIYYWPGGRLIISTEGTKRQTETPAGRIQWLAAGVTHAEEGTSDDSLRAVMIELKGAAASGTIGIGPDPMFNAGIPLLDNPRVLVSDYNGAPATPAHHAHRMDAVVVITDQRVARAIFVPAGTLHDDESTHGSKKVTIFELK